MESAECTAQDANAAEPGCASGRPLQPSERELLSSLLVAMHAVVEQMSAMTNAVAEMTNAMAEQNAILMDLLANQSADDDEAQLDLSGKRLR